MFKLMAKKIITFLRSKNLLNRIYVFLFQVFLGIILVIVKVDISRPQQFSLGSQYFLLAGVTTAIYLTWHVLACSSNTFNSKNMCGWSLGSVLTQAVILVMVQTSVASLYALLQMKARPSSEVCLTHLCRMKFPSFINWTSPFPF